MTTQTQNKGLDYEVGNYEVGRTLLKPRGTNLTFAHPSYRPNTYAEVKQAIEQDNLRTPTMAETASLVHAAFNSDDIYSQEIKGLMKNKWMWAFTGILYTPELGYVEDDPRTRDGMPYMDESDLIKKLEAGDPSVRTFNYGYKIKEMSPIDLAKNEFVQVLAGKEGAEKLAEVAGKYKTQPYLYGYESVSQPETRVSALDSCRDFDHWLRVNGYIHGYSRYGYAFGVQVAPQARAEK